MLGILASNINKKESTTEPEQKVQDHVVDLKNSVDEGTAVKLPATEGIVVGKLVTPTGVEYQVHVGETVQTVQESQVTILPQNSEQAAQILQNVTPESRVKSTKEIFGRQVEENNESVYDLPVEVKEYITPTGEKITALDLSGVAPMDLRFPTIEDILTKPVPTYIPPD